MGVFDCSFAAEAKISEDESRSPCRRVMVCGERAARETAEGEVGERVSARILKGGEDGLARRAEMTARPCWPVAPVMRRVFPNDPDIAFSFVFFLSIEVDNIFSAKWRWADFLRSIRQVLGGLTG